MASAEKVARIKSYYEADPQLWTEQMVHSAVEEGSLSAEDYKTITGNDYEATPVRTVILSGGSLSDNALAWGNPNAEDESGGGD